MNPTLTAAEVADAIGISTSAVYEQIRRGLIPNVAVGRRVAVPRVWLNRHLSAAGVTTPARIELVDEGTFD